MSTATSSSDRIEAAREALKLMRARQAHTVPGDCRECDDLDIYIDAIRALIEPPATDEAMDAEQTQAIYNRAYYKHEKIGSTAAETEHAHAAAREALYQAGIQAAWESWEPESAPGMPSGSLEQLAAEAEEALDAIEHSTEADSMENVFAARDSAGDVLARLVAFVKGQSE